MPILPLGVSLIHVRIWHERTMCAFGHWRPIAQNFGRGWTRAEPWVLWKQPNTQRRPAEARADYMDAILHNVHLHANRMYDIIL